MLRILSSDTENYGVRSLNEEELSSETEQMVKLVSSEADTTVY